MVCNENMPFPSSNRAVGEVYSFVTDDGNRQRRIGFGCETGLKPFANRLNQLLVSPADSPFLILDYGLS
jgi:hypothetical protein